VKAAELGDARWKELLAAHDERARAEIDRHRGRYVQTLGDGLLATFDGPARAVRCAQEIGDAVGQLGVQIRAGCHTGEVELDGDTSEVWPCISVLVSLRSRNPQRCSCPPPSKIWSRAPGSGSKMRASTN
jgi:hypothetical protein